MPEVLETSISWLALRYLKNNSVPSLAIYFFKWQHEVWKTSSCSQKVFKHRHAIRLKYHMHLHSSLYCSLVPNSDISSQDNGSPEEDGKSPPLDPPNGCRNPGGHSTHIQRNHPNSSIAALMCFTHWEQALLAAQGGVPLLKKRKEMADTNHYHYAILNILTLIWPIWTLMHVWTKFTMVSSKSSGKLFSCLWRRNLASQGTAWGECQSKMPPSSHPKGWSPSPPYNSIPPAARDRQTHSLRECSPNHAEPYDWQNTCLRGLARRQPARGGSAYGTGNGGGYFIHHRNGARHSSELALSVPLFVFATACWGVEVFFFWLPLGEVGRLHQRRWKVGSILTKAALPGLAASSRTATGSRVTPEVPQLLQSSRVVSAGTALPRQRSLREACIKNRVVTVNPRDLSGSSGPFQSH